MRNSNSARFIGACFAALTLAEPVYAQQDVKSPAPVPSPAAAPAPVPATPPSAAAPAATGSGWTAEVAKDQSKGLTLDEKQTELVKLVEAYFNDMKSLKGSFAQTGADKKVMKGKFYMKRPGRFRFDYARPSRQIIISDGQNLAIQDLDLNNEDRVSLDQTPFRLLLRKDVDLIRDAIIGEVQQAEDLIVLSVKDKDPETPGQIKLFFVTKPGLELKEWVTSDAQGLDTRVEVADVTQGEDLDAELFKIKPVGPNFTQQ